MFLRPSAPRILKFSRPSVPHSQFPLQLLIKKSHHSEKISSGLKYIFVHPGREMFQFQVIFRGVSMYQFPLELLIRKSNYSENISSCLENIFVHPGREIFQFQIILKVYVCINVLYNC